jgi:predicted transcriptional regulator
VIIDNSEIKNKISSNKNINGKIRELNNKKSNLQKQFENYISNILYK